VLGFALHSDGAGHDSLKLGYSGAQKDLAGGKTVTTGAYAPITMNGREVSLIQQRV
jgi:3-oxoacyl-[acyl-carrier-protein] synthase III